MKNTLAIFGGKPIVDKPMPQRHSIGEDERSIALKIIDESIETGISFRYGGKYEKKYQDEFVKFMGKGYCDGVNSGTNALFAALGALDIPPFSEIIVPAIIDPGGVMPILFHGCVPIMADVTLNSYNSGAYEIEKMISERTKAVIIAHIGGESADLDPILDLTSRKGLYLIEDCSQAHGAEYNGQKVGCFGDISFFSTMASKHHCSGGQGGLIYSTKPELLSNARLCADRGKTVENNVRKYITAGLNCNLDELSAAIGYVQLKKLPDTIERTHEIGETLKESLEKNSDICSVGWQVPNTKCVYWFLRIRLDIDSICVTKKEFCEALSAEGIPVEENYRNTPFEQEWYSKILKADPDKMPWCYSRENLPQNFSHNFHNVSQVVDQHFNILIRENYTKTEVNDILLAIAKVEKAFSK